jgi:phosphatidylglycerophosphate synthase
MERASTLIGIVGVVGLFVLFLGRRGAPRTTDSRAQGQLLPAIVFDFGLWVLDGVIPFFLCLQLTPNVLSLLSLPASVCAATLLATGHFGFAGPILLFAFSLDACDGALARRLGTASDAGEVVDATLDRYNDVIVMLGFLYYFRADLLVWLLGSAALVGTVAVSYIRAKGASFGIDADIGFMQRHERALWLGVATTTAPAISTLLEQPSSHPSYYAVVVALAAVAAGTNITAMRRARLVVATLASRQRASTQTNQPTWSTAAP